MSAERNPLKLLDLLAGKVPHSLPDRRAAFRHALENKDGNTYRLTIKVFEETVDDVVKAVFENFFLHVNIIGIKMTGRLHTETDMEPAGHRFMIIR